MILTSPTLPLVRNFCWTLQPLGWIIDYFVLEPVRLCEDYIQDADGVCRDIEHLAVVLSHWRRVLGDLEKTPATTSLAPPSPPLHLRTGKTTQLPAWEGKPTVKTHSSRFERRAARGGGAEQRRASSWGWRRAREGEKQIGRCGAEKHRIAPPRSSIRIYGSRCIPSVRQLPAAASSCP